MDKSWMKIVHRIKDPRYELGVNEFLDFAYRGKDGSSKVPCPCKNCNNFRRHNKTTIFSHLMQLGVSWNYDKWIYHGESCDVSDDSDDNLSFDDGDGSNDDTSESEDRLDEMLNNIGQSTWGDNWEANGEMSCSSDEDEDKDLDNLRRLLDESHEDLYLGCKNYSKFSFIITILHLKTLSGWSIKSFDALLDIFKKVLPAPSSLPKNFYEAKKYIRELRFGGEKIDACVNDCILYRNEYASHTECPNDECKEPRFSGNDFKVPRKVLRYFPLKSRLQRLFIDKQVACDMRWHKEKRVNDTQLANQHRNKQHRLHKYYKTFPTKEEALTHPPKGIKVSQWVNLCERFTSQDFQKISARNMKNRSCNKVPPAVGTVSIAGIVHMRKKQGEEVSEIENYKIAHFSKKRNKMVNEKAEEILNDLQAEEATSSCTPAEICLKKLHRIPGHTNGRSVSTKENLTTAGLRVALELEKEKSKALEEKVKMIEEGQLRFQEEQIKFQEEQMRFEEKQIQMQEEHGQMKGKMEFMMKELSRLSRLQSKKTA